MKTRLAKTVGNEKALAIYKELLNYTYMITQPLLVDKFVFYEDEINGDDIWNETSYQKRLQQGNDLGERMKNAFADLIHNGYSEISIIGSDCYELTTGIIEQSFTVLQHDDIAIGPAADGGYYLLGMKKLHIALFTNIHWGTDTVLNQTINACILKKLSYNLLQTLHDIDDEKDWLQYSHQQSK